MPNFNATLVSFAFECTALGVALFFNQKLRTRYLPLFTSLIIGVSNDVVSLFRMYAGLSNAVNGNIYVLLDLFIIAWFFRKISSTKTFYFLGTIAVIGLMLWITDNIVINTITDNNSLFRMGSSAMIVLMCLEKLGDITLHNGSDRVLKADVLFIVGLLIYYCFKTFIECFHVFNMKVDRSFYAVLWIVLASIRIITYILFSLAILWAPKRTEFISHL